MFFRLLKQVFLKNNTELFIKLCCSTVHSFASKFLNASHNADHFLLINKKPSGREFNIKNDKFVEFLGKILAAVVARISSEHIWSNIQASGVGLHDFCKQQVSF